MFYNQKTKDAYLKFYCIGKEKTYLKNNPSMDRKSALEIYKAKLEIPASQRPPLISVERSLHLFFTRYAPYEERKHKDLFEFTDQEFLDALKMEKINTYSRILILENFLAQYRKWAASQNLIPKRASYHIPTKVILNNIDKDAALNAYIDEDQFNYYLNKIPNAREKFIFCCMYEGIKGKLYTDISQLKISDIHLPENNFEEALTDEYRPYIAELVSGNKVTVSGRLYDLALAADAEVDYQTLTGDKSKAKLGESKYIVKPRNNQLSEEIKSRGRNIQMTALRILDYLELQDVMKPLNIISSGMINSLLKNAKKHNLSLERYLNSPLLYSGEIDLILKNYGKNKGMTSYINIYRQNKDVIDYLDSHSSDME